MSERIITIHKTPHVSWQGTEAAAAATGLIGDAHEANVNRTENGLALKKNADAPKSMCTLKDTLTQTSEVSKILHEGTKNTYWAQRQVDLQNVPNPQASFEDTTHAYECGYLDGLAKGRRAAVTEGSTAGAPDCNPWLHPDGQYVHGHDCPEAVANGWRRDPAPDLSALERYGLNEGCDCGACNGISPHMEAEDDGEYVLLEAVEALLSVLPAAPAVKVPAYVKVIQYKLQRFHECADDGGDVDIGRTWLDLLTTLGLLERLPNRFAAWSLTDAGAATIAELEGGAA